MTSPATPTDERILDSLPNDIRVAIEAYANEAELSANAVIEGAIKHFLSLDASLSSSAARTAEQTSLLSSLPSVLQSQSIAYAEQDRDTSRASDRASDRALPRSRLSDV